MKVAPTGLAIGLLVSLSPALSAADAAKDFSRTRNPNGVWTYGWYDGSFHRMTDREEISPDVWFWQGGNLLLGEPTIGKNTGTNDFVINGTTFYEPGDMALHPGPNGERAVLRWTAPTGGFYQIDAAFWGGDANTITDVEIETLGKLLLGGDVHGNESPLIFSGLVHVRPRQTIDFSVGYGSNLAYEFDTTLVDIKVVKSSPGEAKKGDKGNEDKPEKDAPGAAKKAEKVETARPK